ncbi:heavy metal-binding domain-containing protein [Sphingomonas abietis]|uniref:Heavy metal-binding domain-containing protein n=1 Tax=Sphingomonas abietis TaxID=3012344 RepID=A0ABY7NHQ7_9SPHN|nr:heavy metal-binding domain-containing protein [Sphingomonas abietis]WBO21019.1 heavy metal-binding domain-containing protein [Sphingomonas abietis]
MADAHGQDIPEHALARLAGLRRAGHPDGIFTSDFSVNEFLLVRKAGFEPVGLCVGSCIYHLGFQFAAWGSNMELDVLSTAMYEARALAMERMRLEAAQMGADGIVGVRLTVKRLEWDTKVLEFVAIGTGVVHAKGHQGFKGPNGQPFTSALSGQDFWTLLAAGYRPLEMVMGSCVYHVARRGPIAALGSIGQNVELTNFSLALYEAREIAMERMQTEASQAGAEGVVGADLHEGSHNWSPHVIEFFAIGTAVLPIEGHEADDIPDPRLVLSVNS